MSGSIQDCGLGRGGKRRWRLRADAGRDVVTGKRIQSSRYFVGGIRDAQKELARMVTDLTAKRDQVTHATVGHLLTEWLRLQENQGLSSTTIGTRTGHVRNRIIPALGHIALADLTARDLDRFYASQIETLSPRSVNHLHATIHRALAQAVKWGWVERNMADLASPPRVTNGTVVSIEPSALAEFLREANRRDPRLERIIALAALTGARRGELCGLKLSDCDRIGRMITIRRAIKWSSQKGVEVGATKTHAERIVALDDIGIEVLNRQVASLHEIAAATGLTLPADPWLFPGPDLVSPLNPDRISGAFRRIAVAIGKTEFHFHSLRHFSATEMIAAGVDVRTVAARLGHADASVTLRVYAHALPERDRAAAELLGTKITLSLPDSEV